MDGRGTGHERSADPMDGGSVEGDSAAEGLVEEWMRMVEQGREKCKMLRE